MPRSLPGASIPGARRAKGTGTIYRRFGRWWAEPPRKLSTDKHDKFGPFESYREADRALGNWITNNGGRAA